jgi:hypothetical protein
MVNWIFFCFWFWVIGDRVGTGAAAKANFIHCAVGKDSKHKGQ